MRHRHSSGSANNAWTRQFLMVVVLCVFASWPASAQAPSSAEGLLTLALHTPSQVLDGSAIPVSHYNPGQKLRLVLSVQPPHMAEEEQFLKQLITKGSPNFHKFLTPEQWNARFAPSQEEEQQVVDWAKSQGLTVTNRYNHRLIVDVEAPAGVIEKAFGVTINNYQVGEEVDFSNDRDPIIPASLSGIVFNIQGLNNIQREHGTSRELQNAKGPDYAAGPVVAAGGSAHGDGDPSKAPASLSKNGGPVSNITNGFMDPSDLFSSETYNYNGLYRFSHCCNVPGDSGGSPAVSSIAIAGFGEFLESDINGFAGAYGLAWHNYYYYIDGSSSFCNTGVTPPCATGETTEDIEWSTATSNSFGSYLDTAEEYIYLGANFNLGTYTDIYSQMLSDNTARVMTTSWSCTEIYGCSTSTMDSRHNIFVSMVGEGWTLIAASGDRGATDDCNTSHIAISYPASDPLVIAAGGTQLSLFSNGTWDGEQGWTGGQFSGACGENDGGSGGGVSAYYAQPSWQSGYPKVAALGSMRLTPDLSLNALGIGQNLYINGSMSGDGNGTSVVAPELAGFFAQENSYLQYIGNICGSASNVACTPAGDPHAWIYENGNGQTYHDPFYDITTGCNSNDITTAGDLPYYCAGTGFDLVTGWGSANMMQLAWGINWQLIPAYSKPSIAFSGPATNTWYNSNQQVDWTVTDGVTQGTNTPSGIAGFTQGWDSIPSDAYSEAHGGVNTSNSFYYGPYYAFGTTGCLAFVANGCSGGVSQGCHTVNVEAWDNQGSTTTATYGPLCYDTVVPTITASTNPATSGTVWVNKPVVVTVTATDPGGAGASGIKTTYYAINSTSCYPGSVSTCSVYTAPFTVSLAAQSYIYMFTEDNAGNFSTEPYIWVSIDETAPVTTAALTGTTAPSGSYKNTVQVTLSATDTGGSGVAKTLYQLNGGSWILYSGAFNVTQIGANTVNFYSSDNAGNVEKTKTVTFGISETTNTSLASSVNPSGFGKSVTFTAVVTPFSGVATGKVTFKNGAAVLGTVALSGGLATFSTSALAVGSHPITADFLGSPNILASVSAPLHQVVEHASTTVVTSSANPSKFGETVTFTATIKHVATPIPTGTVTFKAGSTVLAAVAVGATGTAEYAISTFTAATHSITAVYSGDSEYIGSTSAAFSQVVDKAATSTGLVSSLNPSVSGDEVTFTATVTVNAPGAGTPGGTVTFMDGSTTLGTGTLNSKGKATFAISTLTEGTHSITAVYGGRSNFVASTSAALSQQVNP
jgi:Pro-kumamolisin, activation domain/Bacterial Ig-like domain (group 3)